MAIVISRSESQLSATTSFQSMDNLAGASVSSSFTVPSNVSSIKNITMATTADAAEEFVPFYKISGNAMRDGDAVFTGPANVPTGSATGPATNFGAYDTDLAVQPGNSVEISVAVSDAATISAGVTLTFA